MLIIDTHVHIHDRFRLDQFFASAHLNISRAAAKRRAAEDFTGVLMLTEACSANWFAALASMAEEKQTHPGREMGRWKLSPTGEDASLRVHDGDQRALLLIAGRQVVTAEKLEVLALFVAEPIEDGRPIRDVLARVEALGGQPVLPWGFGKWSGRRGKVLDQLIKEADRPMVCFGDNGGRPAFLPEPRQFRFAREKGIPILPGSDPLPFSTEDGRAGSFGCCIDAEVSLRQPAGDLKRILKTPGMLPRRYGQLETPLRFVRNQIKMQLWKRHWIVN
jgi:hypothetical protein